MNRSYLILGLILLCAVSIASCLKKNYDAPPDTTGYDPMLKVDTSIAALKSLNGFYDYKTGGDTTLITRDITISGIVTADDHSGNLYKQIIIQYATGAIMLKLDANSLYNDYPVGRKLYVKCKGLTLGYDDGLPVLGFNPDTRLSPTPIPVVQLKEHLITGNIGNTVIPDTLTLMEAKNASTNAAFYNKLVVITDAEFEDTMSSYAQPTGATSRNIIDCDTTTNRLVLRTSNYASFANAALPKGRGTITGIYTVFVSPTSGSRTAQLLIRDTNDVKFAGTRCGGAVTQPSNTLIALDSLRKLYQGNGIKLGSYSIKGIVISDVTNKNVSSGSVILQDGSKGVSVYWGGTISYNMGDSLLLDVTGDSLIMFQGMLEIKRASSAAKPAPVATAKQVSPRQVSIAQLNVSFQDYESTLVKVANATIIGSGTYSGNKTLSDATGTITLYTATTAIFANQAVPTSPKTFVGIVTPFTGGVRELKLRDPAIDVY
jgi:hypothetical protein